MVRTRIAPSPTGEDIHIGNLYTAYLNWIYAKKHNGKFIVRIEDTDWQRRVEGAEEKILKSLLWLGLKPDEGPQIGGSFGPYRQSERKNLYIEYAQKLVERGFAYYCFCSPQRLEKLRKNLQKTDRPPMYDGFCKGLTLEEAEKKIKEGEMYVVRLAVPKKGETSFNDLIRGKVTFQNALIDDQILLKSDGYPTYHLAVVVDDHLMKITHVIRAEEWLSSTPKHILLYQAFGWQPPEFAHTPILRNPDKSKLSKRKNPVWLSWYRQQGFLPEAIKNYLLTLGWSHPEDKTIFPFSEAIEKFNFSRVVKSGPIFDIVKLTWMNGEYIRAISNQDLAEKLYSFLNKKIDRRLLLRICPLLRERIKKLSEAENLIDFFYKEPVIDQKLIIPKKRTKDEVKSVLENVLKHFQSSPSWKAETLHKIGDELVNWSGWKPVELFQMVRVAITGKSVTPPLFESMEILGRSKVLKRLEHALKSFDPVRVNLNC